MLSGTRLTGYRPCSISNGHGTIKRFRIEPEVTTIHKTCHRHVYAYTSFRLRSRCRLRRNRINQSTTCGTEYADFGVSLNCRFESHRFYTGPTVPICSGECVEECTSRHVTTIFQGYRGTPRNFKRIAGHSCRRPGIAKQALQCGLIHGAEFQTTHVYARIQRGLRHMWTGPVNRIQRESLLGILDRIHDTHNSFPSIARFGILHRSLLIHASSPTTVFVHPFIVVGAQHFRQSTHAHSQHIKFFGKTKQSPFFRYSRPKIESILYQRR